jgi:hypothetical protein
VRYLLQLKSPKITLTMDSNWDSFHRVVNVPAPSVLWLADPPQPSQLAIPPVRALLPRFMTIASEISLDKKGRLVLGRITSMGLLQRRLLEPADDKQRSVYPSTCYASTHIKSYLSCRNEYKKPFTRPMVVEERRCGQDMSQPTTIPEVQATFLYAEVSNKKYPRDGQDFGRTLDIIPSFEFPEIIMNLGDIKNNDGKLVFAAHVTKTMLEHLILRVDVNDSLLSDLQCLLTLPSRNESVFQGTAKVKAKGKVKSRELVQSHLNHGRWVWVTEQFKKTPWRNVLACQSADLMDARLAYWQWGDDPRRIEFIRTAIKGYPLICGEYNIMEEYLGIRCMAPKLDAYFHHITSMSLEKILAVERFGWANLGGPTALAEEVSWQMRKIYGTSVESSTAKPKGFFWSFFNRRFFLIGRRAENRKIDSGKTDDGKIDNGKKREMVTSSDLPWIENGSYGDTIRPTAVGYIPGLDISCLPTDFSRKITNSTNKQICSCDKPCASASGVGPLHVLEERSSDDTRSKHVKVTVSGKKGVQVATAKLVVTTPSLPVLASPARLIRTLREANSRVVPASRFMENFIQPRRVFDDVSFSRFSLPRRNGKSKEEVEREGSALIVSAE